MSDRGPLSINTSVQDFMGSRGRTAVLALPLGDSWAGVFSRAPVVQHFYDENSYLRKVVKSLRNSCFTVVVAKSSTTQGVNILVSAYFQRIKITYGLLFSVAEFHSWT